MSDNRRDQLIEFVEREFIGPDPIDWPGMTQSNGQEILASDPPRTRYIAGILYPAETTDDKADLKDDECELLDEADGEDVEVKPQKLGDGTVEFLEDSPTVSQVEKLSRLLDYCKTMRMSYSYKPILILALLHYGDRDGCISIENAAVYFREYYSNRKAQGLAIEKKQCIYLRDDVTDAQIIANLLSNPVKALIESGFFFYNEDSHVFSVSPDIWSTIDRSNKAAITRICRQKLKDYYKD